MEPFSKAKDIASMKAVHSNFNEVPLWKRTEWKSHIRNWRDENLTYKRWVYQYGTLPPDMIKNGWENKINKDYRHQRCYVKNVFGKVVGTGFVEEAKQFKVIYFEVNVLDLLTGVRELPSCFGVARECHNQDLITCGRTGGGFVPRPSLETLIPVEKRREWLKECFKECVLKHWCKKITDICLEKNDDVNENPDFIKEFKKLMGVPYNYKLSYTDLFRMFLRELMVSPRPVREKEGYFKRSESINDISRKYVC
jgi:hypothetical protein